LVGAGNIEIELNQSIENQAYPKHITQVKQRFFSVQFNTKTAVLNGFVQF